MDALHGMQECSMQGKVHVGRLVEEAGRDEQRHAPTWTIDPLKVLGAVGVAPISWTQQPHRSPHARVQRATRMPGMR